MNKKKWNIRQGAKFATMFIALFGITTATSYFLIPTNVREGVAQGNDSSDSENSSGDGTGITPADRFMKKLSSTTGVDGQMTLNASFVDKKGNTDSAGVSGTLSFMMPSTDNVGLVLDSTLSYNDESEHLSVNYVDEDLYFAFGDLKYVISNTSANDIVNCLINILGEGIFMIPDGAFSNINVNDILSTFSLSTVSSDSNGYTYLASFQDGDSNLYKATLTSDSNYNLTSISVPSCSIDGITLALNLKTAVNSNIASKIVAPSDKASYLEVVDSLNIFTKMYSLVQSKQFNVAFNGSLSNSDNKIALGTTADLNFSSHTFDVSNKFSAVDPSNDVKSQTLSLHYIPDSSTGRESAYLNYNDAFKASMSSDTIDELLGRIKKSNTGTSKNKLSKLFTFVTDSTLMERIETGHYESILSYVSTVTTENNVIKLGISLDGLGLGSSSLLTVTVNGLDSAPSILSLDFASIDFDGYTFSGDLTVGSYSSSAFSSDGYYELSSLPTVYDQALALTESEQASLQVSGSAYDSNSYGYSFAGNTTFDVPSKSGTGKIDITEKAAKYVKDHIVTIDVLGTDKMLFTYNSGLKGKFTIQTLNDIISLIKELTDSADERYTKFFDPIKEASATTILSQLSAGNIQPAVEDGILVSSSLSDDTSCFMINGSFVGADSTFGLMIRYGSDHKISSLSISSLLMNGKTINLTVTLCAYSGALSQLNPNDSYMDFSDIAILLRYGIKTSALSTYHITALADLNLWVFNTASIPLDFYITVDGKVVNVYGTITDIPLIAGVNTKYIFGGKRSLEFIFSNESTPSHDAGYFYVHSKNKMKFRSKTVNEYKRYTQDYFVDNIVSILCGDMIGLTDSNMQKINASSAGESSTPVSYDKVLTSFVYDNSSIEWSLGIDLAELTQNSQLGTMALNIWGGADDYLKKAAVDVKLNAVVTIELSMDASLVGKNITIPSSISSAFNSYLSSHGSDTALGE